MDLFVRTDCLGKLRVVKWDPHDAPTYSDVGFASHRTNVTHIPSACVADILAGKQFRHRPVSVVYFVNNGHINLLSR